MFWGCVLVGSRLQSFVGGFSGHLLCLVQEVSGVPSISEVRPSHAVYDLGSFGVTLLALVLLGWHLSEEQAHFWGHVLLLSSFITVWVF